MRFFTVENLGPKQSLTPAGFLVCHDVPIARTGQMLYGSGEVPVEASLDGLVRVSRDADEVFRPETIASFEGVAVTMDHPSDFVTPANWNELAVGTVMNVRRGTGLENDLLLADLMLTNQKAIDEVRSGLREVSCGYDASYEQLEPGRGVQREIVGNHVALVERGRCGSRCAIGDKEPEMAKKPSFLDKLRALMKDAESEMEEKEKTDDEESESEKKDEGKTGDSALIKTLMKRMEAQDALLASLATLVKGQAKDADGDDDEDDETAETGDDVLEAEKAGTLNQAEVDLYTGDSAKTILSRAEILSPGIKLPTLDAKASTKDQAAALCKCQRKALDLAYQTEAGKAAITPFIGSKTADFEQMPVALVNAAFMGASELMKAQNNGRAHASAAPTKDFGKRSTVADINQRNREYWADRSAK